MDNTCDCGARKSDPVGVQVYRRIEQRLGQPVHTVATGPGKLMGKVLAVEVRDPCA